MIERIVSATLKPDWHRLMTGKKANGKTALFYEKMTCVGVNVLHIMGLNSLSVHTSILSVWLDSNTFIPICHPDDLEMKEPAVMWMKWYNTGCDIQYQPALLYFQAHFGSITCLRYRLLRPALIANASKKQYFSDLKHDAIYHPTHLFIPL